MLLMQKIKNHFGSKRGLLNTIICAVKLKCGAYRKYQKIPLSSVKRFIFICSGNICRSPLAEYVAKTQGANTISFGLHCRGGDPADPRALNYAKKVGIDLTPHVTQNIRHYIPQEGDLLVGMEPKHAEELAILMGDKVAITLVGLWLDKPTAYIHDPYSAAEYFFDLCEAQVVSGVKALLQKHQQSEVDLKT